MIALIVELVELHVESCFPVGADPLASGAETGYAGRGVLESFHMYVSSDSHKWPHIHCLVVNNFFDELFDLHLISALGKTTGL